MGWLLGESDAPLTRVMTVGVRRRVIVMVYDLIVAHHERNRIIAREGRVQGTPASLEVVLAVFDLVIVLMVAGCLGPR